jgi:hypothetical protein
MIGVAWERDWYMDNARDSQFGGAPLPLPIFLVRTEEDVETLRDSGKRTTDWTMFVWVPIVLLVFFSRFIYPKVHASWGGGEPVPVVLYFTKDSPLKPNEAVPALLRDESDSGFYFAEENTSHATFMPRSQVSMLFFSDKPIPTPSPKPGAPTAEPSTPRPQPGSQSPAQQPKQ